MSEIHLMEYYMPTSTSSKPEEFFLHNLIYIKKSQLRNQEQQNAAYLHYNHYKNNPSLLKTHNLPANYIAQLGQILEMKQASIEQKEYAFSLAVKAYKNKIPLSIFYEKFIDIVQVESFVDDASAVDVNSKERHLLLREQVGNISSRSIKLKKDTIDYSISKGSSIKGDSVHSTKKVNSKKVSLSVPDKFFQNLEIAQDSLKVVDPGFVTKFRGLSGEEIPKKLSAEIKEFKGFLKKRLDSDLLRSKSLKKSFNGKVSGGYKFNNSFIREARRIKEKLVEDIALKHARYKDSFESRIGTLIPLVEFLDYADLSSREMINNPHIAIDVNELEGLLYTFRENANLINDYKNYDPLVDAQLLKDPKLQESLSDKDSKEILKFLTKEEQESSNSRSEKISNIWSRLVALNYNNSVVKKRYSQSTSSFRGGNFYKRPKNSKHSNALPGKDLNLAGTIPVKQSIQCSTECFGFAVANEINQHLNLNEEDKNKRVSSRYAYAIGHIASLSGGKVNSNNLKEQRKFLDKKVILDHSDGSKEVLFLDKGGVALDLVMKGMSSKGIPLEENYSSSKPIISHEDLFPEDTTNINGPRYVVDNYEDIGFGDKNKFTVNYIMEFLNNKSKILTVGLASQDYLLNEDWIRFKPETSKLGHAVNIVGYGYDYSPFDEKYKPYFILRDSNHKFIYDAKIGAEELVNILNYAVTVNKVSREKPAEKETLE